MSISDCQGQLENFSKKIDLLKVNVIVVKIFIRNWKIKFFYIMEKIDVYTTERF